MVMVAMVVLVVSHCIWECVCGRLYSYYSLCSLFKAFVLRISFRKLSHLAIVPIGKLWESTTFKGIFLTLNSIFFILSFWRTLCVRSLHFLVCVCVSKLPYVTHFCVDGIVCAFAWWFTLHKTIQFIHSISFIHWTFSWQAPLLREGAQMLHASDGTIEEYS